MKPENCQDLRSAARLPARARLTLTESPAQARAIVKGLVSIDGDLEDPVESGASGFIMKKAAFEEVLRTIRPAAGDVTVVPAELGASMSKPAVGRPAPEGPARILAANLTRREGQVMQLIGAGLSNKEIATQLHIAVDTVKSHVHNLLTKLAVHTRLEVAVLSYRELGVPRRPRFSIIR